MGALFRHGGGGSRRAFGSLAGGRRAFTLLELLVVTMIIAVLISILAPALHHTLEASKAHECKMSQRSVSFDFTVFADPQLHGDRGDDVEQVGRNAFRLETFQESQYGIDEFWSHDTSTWFVKLSGGVGDVPMRCPKVKGDLTLRQFRACTNGGVSPASSVSFGFNRRLHAGVRGGSSGQTIVGIGLRPDTFTHPAATPLFWDVDGRLAEERGRSPFFSAPQIAELNEPDYAGDRYWFPAYRHLGAANVAFVDGHVDSSKDLLAESGWRWEFSPLRRGN